MATYSYRIDSICYHTCCRCGRRRLDGLNCKRCGSMQVSFERFQQATILRNGQGTWVIEADTKEEAERRAIAWLDTYKPAWRDENAYAGEVP